MGEEELQETIATLAVHVKYMAGQVRLLKAENDALRFTLTGVKVNLPDELKRLLREGTPGAWRVVQGPTHLQVRAPHQTGIAPVCTVYCDLDAALIVELHQFARNLLGDTHA